MTQELRIHTKRALRETEDFLISQPEQKMKTMFGEVSETLLLRDLTKMKNKLKLCIINQPDRVVLVNVIKASWQQRKNKNEIWTKRFFCRKGRRV